MTKVVHDSETPAHGQQVISACAFIYHNFEGVNKVFLAKRADTKKFLPGFYELPGGHINFGEDVVAGLKREVQEEFGMNIIVGEPFTAFTYVNTVKSSHTVEVIYFATFADPLENIKLNPEDHSRFDWFTKEEVIAHRPQMQAIYEEGEDDPEYAAAVRGFDILSGEPLRFG